MQEATKSCTACCATKPLADFNRRAASLDGYQPRCRACERASKRAYYLRERPVILAKMRATNAADPSKNRQKVRDWTAQNKQRARQRERAWRDANRDLARKWSRDFARRHADRVRANTTMQRAKRRAAPRVPFTADQLALRLSMFAGCWICGGPKTTIDHVKPLAKGGTHMLGNLRPACGPCNSSKQDTWPYARR